jgi:hypothetical protein
MLPDVVAGPLEPLAKPEVLPGYQVIGDMVIMWGEGRCGIPVVFPVVLADNVFRVMAHGDNNPAIHNLSKTGFTAYGYHPGEFSWMAIGSTRPREQGV